MRGRYRTALAALGAVGLVATSACGGDDAATTTTATPVATDVSTNDGTNDDTNDDTTNDDTTNDGTNNDTNDDDTNDDTNDGVTDDGVTDDGVTDDDGAAGDADRPTIVATTTIWADVVRNVVCGDLAAVDFVVPPGADSHDFEPSLQDRQRLGEADLVVVNGFDLEEGLLPTIAAVDGDGVPVFAIAEAVDEVIEFDDDDHAHDDEHVHDDDHAHDDEHAHAHGPDDPHVWFDPVRVAGVLPVLADAIVEATGLDAESVETCAAAYGQDLLDTTAEMRDVLDAVEPGQRKIVTSHESLGYFADRFDFEIIGTVLTGSSSLAETNPAALDALTNAIRDAGVPAVFAEAEASSADLDAVASRAGVEVVTLRTESLGAAGSGADTYVGFLLDTATTVASALGR